jgi:HEAT repeat protein
MQTPKHVILSAAPRVILSAAPRVILSAAKDLLLSLATVAVFAPVATAQSLASRVDRAPDGVVRMQIRSRPGVCGDGAEMIGYRDAIFGRNFQSIGGRWSAPRCVPGDLRVTAYKVDGDVTRIRTEVGRPWPVTEQRVTDLGVVDPDEASAYFFSLVPKLERRDVDRMLLPAVLADAEPPIQPLLRLARDGDRRMDTRKSAIQWVGLLGDASVIPTLVQFARGGDDRDEKGIGGAAIAALSMLDGDVGVPSLIDLARPGEGSIATRKNAVFWLGQNGDLRARRMLRSVIENANEATEVRSHAVFSLTHGRETPEAEFAWLRGAYPRIREDKIKEQVFQGMTGDEEPAGGRWMIERAIDDDESMNLRRSALFWAGQRKETPTADLVRVYRDVPELELREHAIFVLSQRSDDQSLEALMRIAREDRDTKMRGKALFWLGQKNDERARKLIADIVLRQP